MDMLTPHHYGWQAEGDEEQYVASCYHGQRYQPTLGSRRRGTRGRQQDRLRIHVNRAQVQTQIDAHAPGAPAPTR